MTTVTNTALTFLELVRAARARQRRPCHTWFYQWCDQCQADTRWRLADEGELAEVYVCGGCGCRREYRVR